MAHTPLVGDLTHHAAGAEVLKTAERDADERLMYELDAALERVINSRHP
jgi:hypothetical protein